MGSRSDASTRYASMLAQAPTKIWKKVTRWKEGLLQSHFLLCHFSTLLVVNVVCVVQSGISSDFLCIISWSSKNSRALRTAFEKCCRFENSRSSLSLICCSSNVKKKANVLGTAINIDLLFDCQATACCFGHRAKLNNRWKRSNDTVRRYRRVYSSQRATITCTITYKFEELRRRDGRSYLKERQTFRKIERQLELTSASFSDACQGC